MNEWMRENRIKTKTKQKKEIKSNYFKEKNQTDR